MEQNFAWCLLQNGLDCPLNVGFERIVTLVNHLHDILGQVGQIICLIFHASVYPQFTDMILPYLSVS